MLRLELNRIEPRRLEGHEEAEFEKSASRFIPACLSCVMISWAVGDVLVCEACPCRMTNSARTR